MTDADRAALRKALAVDEGLRLTPYRCPAGKLTIGYGRNLEDRGISEATALQMLDEDIDSHAKDLETAYPWVRDLDPVRYRVLVNMAFNMGIRTLSQFKTTLGYIRRGEYDAAADAMQQSLWAKQVKGRARRLADEMRTGVA
jgi:lysozyme